MLEFKIKYTPALYMFLERILKSDDVVIFYLNKNKNELQVRMNDCIMRFDDEYIHVQLTRVEVLNKHWRLPKLYTWKHFMGIKLVKLDGVVLDSYEINYKRSWVKRLCSYFKWRML